MWYVHNVNINDILFYFNSGIKNSENSFQIRVSYLHEINLLNLFSINAPNNVDLCQRIRFLLPYVQYLSKPVYVIARFPSFIGLF